MAISLLRSRLVIGLFQKFVSKFRLGGLCSCGCTVITKTTHWAQSNVDFLNLKWRIYHTKTLHARKQLDVYIRNIVQKYCAIYCPLLFFGIPYFCDLKSTTKYLIPSFYSCYVQRAVIT